MCVLDISIPGTAQVHLNEDLLSRLAMPKAASTRRYDGCLAEAERPHSVHQGVSSLGMVDQK